MVRVGESSHAVCRDWAHTHNVESTVHPSTALRPANVGCTLEAPSADNLPLTVLEPRRARLLPDLGELWRHRELVGFLAWRDLKVRYRQTLLGAAWAIVQPLGTMIVFSLFFGRLARMPSDGMPYPLFALAALVPWTFFANALQAASGSLVAHQSLLTKVYFPRAAVPLAPILSGLVDLLCALMLVAVVMAWEGVVPTARVAWLVPFSLVAATAAFGAGLFLSALNVAYRDVRYVLPFLVQVWLFATPVAYPVSLLAQHWQYVYAINPMVGVVEGFRWALMRGGAPPVTLLVVSAASAVLMLVMGGVYFGRRERRFADIV